MKDGEEACSYPNEDQGFLEKNKTCFFFVFAVVVASFDVFFVFFLF